MQKGIIQEGNEVKTYTDAFMRKTTCVSSHCYDKTEKAVMKKVVQKKKSLVETVFALLRCSIREQQIFLRRNLLQNM